MLRFANKDDVSDLLKAYGDKQALPFFNSDNCDGNNFYYPTIERMEKCAYLFGWGKERLNSGYTSN